MPNGENDVFMLGDVAIGARLYPYKPPLLLRGTKASVFDIGGLGFGANDEPDGDEEKNRGGCALTGRNPVAEGGGEVNEPVPPALPPPPRRRSSFIKEE
jgi:hypothetical protein